MNYAIIDVETTGPGNKITEISVFKFDGLKVIDEFTTLVNPERLIPDYITALTGIDDAMVAGAPTFTEIANQVLSITADCVFVAHSVNFDYNVIRNECRAIGIDFRRRKLCTVRLSRKLLPGYRSYGLGNLCRSLGIMNKARHRARGDAEAAMAVLQILMEQPDWEAVVTDFLKANSKEATLPPHLARQVFEDIPSDPGIYYFKDKKGAIIYVGKAKNIQKRVLGHFYNKSERELNLCRETADIDYELSGSELVAGLMEDAAIKHYFPKYNRAAKRIPRAHAVFSFQDRAGIVHLAYNTLKATAEPLLTFYTITDCRQFLEQLCTQFELCPKYCHLQEGVPYCSHYKIRTCNGVCKGHEAPEAYNARVKAAIEEATTSGPDFIIRKKGRHVDEEAFVLIRNSRYFGYGFVDRSEQIMSPSDLEPFLIPQKHSVDVQRLLRPYVPQVMTYMPS